MENVYNQLKDGRKLCQYEFISHLFYFFSVFLFRLMNAIQPNSIPKINGGK
jgi:hypothetical protein